jgi:hypothetical protein
VTDTAPFDELSLPPPHDETTPAVITKEVMSKIDFNEVRCRILDSFLT